MYEIQISVSERISIGASSNWHTVLRTSIGHSRILGPPLRTLWFQSCRFRLFFSSPIWVISFIKRRYHWMKSAIWTQSLGEALLMYSAGVRRFSERELLEYGMQMMQRNSNRTQSARTFKTCRTHWICQRKRAIQLWDCKYVHSHSTIDICSNRYCFGRTLRLRSAERYRGVFAHIECTFQYARIHQILRDNIAFSSWFRQRLCYLRPQIAQPIYILAVHIFY